MKKDYPPIYNSKLPHSPFPQNETEQELALKENYQLKEFAEYRRKMKDHPYEPSYHFTAPDGMINDPNGLCFWRGKCHLFYQAYPPADPRQHWGHAVSDDMVHWKDLPIAIYPNIEYAVFSGSSLVEENRVIAMYHGRNVGNMIATSSDPLLLNWEKDASCPVIPSLPDSGDGKPYRIFDPFIWKQEEGYYALSGTHYGPEEARSTGADNRMVEHLFFSQNLSDWTYLGELTENGFPQIPPGNDGACPYFWPLGDKYALFFFSHRTGPYCITGTYDKLIHKFHPEKSHKFNFGPVGCSSYQAPCATPDGKGGVYLIFNTKDANPTLTRKGMMTVMYHVSLDAEGELVINPVKELDSLHVLHHTEKDMALPAFKEKMVDFRGRELDIRMKVDLKDARGLAIKVLRSDDNREYTGVNICRSNISRGGGSVSMFYLTVDTTRSSLLPEVSGRIPETSEFACKPGEKLDIRILVDRCIIEVFVNSKVVLMQMVYPSLDDSTGISIEALGSCARTEAIDIWKMASIY